MIPHELLNDCTKSQAPNPQNDQTHSKNNCLSVFDHFVRLAIKGLNSMNYETVYKVKPA